MAGTPHALFFDNRNLIQLPMRVCPRIASSSTTVALIARSTAIRRMIFRPLADLREIAVVGGLSFPDTDTVHRRALANEEQSNIALPIPVDRSLAGMFDLRQYLPDGSLPRH